MLVFGTAVFAIASVLCAVAPNLELLIAARWLQGASSAMLMPNSLAILGQTFSGEAKGRAIGIWAASGAAGGALGPVLGGWLIDIGSWRYVFLINVPLALGAMAMARIAVPADRPVSGDRLDGLGATLATAGLFLTTWALTEGSSRGWSGWVVAALAAGAALLVSFVAAEKRQSERAMMPLALFGSASFVGLTLLTFLLYGALGGLFVLVPYLLIEAGGYSATQAGAALLPLPLVISLTSPLAGAFAAKAGPRLPLTLGPLVVACGFLLSLRIGNGANYFSDVLPAMVVIAVGMAGAVAPLTTAVLSSVDDRHTGTASGFNSATARTGGLIATALSGAVIAQSGLQLISAFHAAALVGAALAIAAGIAAFLTLETRPPRASG